MKRIVKMVLVLVVVLMLLFPASAETPSPEEQLSAFWEFYVTKTPEPTPGPTVNPDLQAEYERMRVLYEEAGRIDEYDEVMFEIEWNEHINPLLCEVIRDEVQAETLRIGKGTEDGIEPGMLVVFNGALIGIISEAETDSATVQTILHPGFSIMGRIRIQPDQIDKYVEGIVSVMAEKNDKNLLQMSVSAESIDFMDETVQTSNNGPAVSGITIGKICHTICNEDGQLESITIEPYADFEWLPYVIVLRVTLEPQPKPTPTLLDGHFWMENNEQ